MTNAIPLLLAAFLAAVPTPAPWTGVKVLGWTPDGKTIAWLTFVGSVEEAPGGGEAGRLEFLVLTDARGTIRRLLRNERHTLDEGRAWSVPAEAERVWKNAEPESAAEAWRGEHERALTGVPEVKPLAGELVDDAGNVPIRLAVAASGKGCPTLSLTARMGDVAGTLAEDRCERGEFVHKTQNSFVQVSWAPDRTRAAIAWYVGRQTAFPPDAPPGIARAHLVVASRQAVASVDVLDAGAGTGADALAGKVEAAGFRVGHRGKAGTPRATTEIYFAPGFEAEAKEIAVLTGAAADAVKPLSWKSPYAVTVAAGAGR